MINFFILEWPKSEEFSDFASEKKLEIIVTSASTLVVWARAAREQKISRNLEGSQRDTPLRVATWEIFYYYFKFNSGNESTNRA